MIGKRDFNKLRLNNYLNKKDIKKVVGFEYLNKIWVGDTHYFTEWLRPITNPFKTKSISLDLKNLPIDALTKIARDIGIPISQKISKSEFDEMIGAPFEVEKFADDRKTFNYKTKCGNYFLTATFINEGGLVYFTMNTSDIPL